MSEEVTIDKIKWSALEYNHKERSTDWYWTMGLITLVICIIALWTKSYLFAIFIVISGSALMLFSVRHPEEIIFSIETEGLTMNKDKYEWSRIKGFDIKKRDGVSKLLIETNKHFLPTYTLPIPNNMLPQIKESLLKVIPKIELKESQSMLFMEKIGF